MDWQEKYINTVQCGDALELLKQLPNECIDMCITSPPYWSQRDYKIEGQWGLEKTYQEWLAHMWALMDEVWRVLRKDGTVFCNLGDKYGGSGMGMSYAGQSKGPHSILTHLDHMPAVGHSREGFDKSLLLLPERFAIGCLERGWILRNKIIWHKPNPMPCSAKDRFTTTWEYMFFMVKSRKYWFDLDAVRRPHAPYSKEMELKYKPSKPKNYGDKNVSAGSFNKMLYEGGIHLNPAGANPGDVVCTDPTDFWTIPTQASKLAHYASYPEKLVETPLKAGCPRWICKECSLPRTRITKPSEEYAKRLGHDWSDKKHRQKTTIIRGKDLKSADYLTVGWSFCACLCPACGQADCKCGAKWRPGIVLDPFGGTGRTCVVAKRLGLDWIYIDIKPEYVEMARKEIMKTDRQEEIEL